jgi:hypothetical protein
MQNPIIQNDSNDIESFIDYFVRRHLLTYHEQSYRISRYFEHFLAPIVNSSFLPNETLFVKEVKMFSADQTLQMSADITNEDGQTWTYNAPVIAVRTTGALLYLIKDAVSNVGVASFQNVTNIDYMEIYGYLITVDP